MDQCIGNDRLCFFQANLFTPERVGLISQVASTVSIAIQQNQLLTEERQSREFAEALHAATQEFSLNLAPERIIDILLDSLATVIDFENVTTMMIETENLSSIYGFRSPRQLFDADATGVLVNTANYPLFNQIATTKKGILIPNTDQHPDWQQIMGAWRIKSWIGLPLLVNNKIYAHFYIDHSEPNRFNEKHFTQAETLIRNASLAIQNAQNFQIAQQKAQEFSALYGASQAVTSVLAKDEILEIIIREAISLIDTNGGWIYLANPDQTIYQCAVAFSPSAKKLLQHTFPIGQGMLGRVAETGQGEISNDVLGDKNAVVISGIEINDECRMISPLIFQNQVIGVMVVNRLGLDNPFTVDDMGLLNAFATQAAMAIENANLLHEEQIARNTSEVLREARTSH